MQAAWVRAGAEAAGAGARTGGRTTTNRSGTLCDDHHNSTSTLLGTNGTMCRLHRSNWPIPGEDFRVPVKLQLRLGLLLVSVSAAAFAKDLPNYDESSVTKNPAA